ncbi:hypothetical protein QQ045_010658 [Rhodiola kirilowii]
MSRKQATIFLSQVPSDVELEMGTGTGRAAAMPSCRCRCSDSANYYCRLLWYSMKHGYLAQAPSPVPDGGYVSIPYPKNGYFGLVQIRSLLSGAIIRSPLLSSFRNPQPSPSSPPVSVTRNPHPYKVVQ